MPIYSLFPPSSLTSNLLPLLLFFTIFLHQSNSLQFQYQNFTDGDEADFDFNDQQSRIYRGALQITRDTGNRDDGMWNSSGRILYKDEFRLWKKGDPVLASFNTTFVLQIVPMDGSGEGLAFILTNNKTMPAGSHGRWLGIVNEENKNFGIVAVEFDTRKSSTDDIDGNHVGIDVNGINSTRAVSLTSYGVNLASASDVIASVVYNGTSKNMSIFVAMGNSTSSIDQSNPVISLPIDLSEFLMEDVHIGFSGSTGNETQLNCIRAWSFSGEEKGTKKQTSTLWILIGVLSSVLICLLILLICWRKKRNDRIKLRQKKFVDSMLEGAPRKFELKELKSATANFHPNNKLGEGGFGTVYKGVLKDTKEPVAVKRVSKDSKQGEQEFISEVTTIGRLSHKNLVKLIGWCYQSKDDFLLVYEFMPNGSLDNLLFSNESCSSSDECDLSWDRRHNIISGVAHALCYLHNGCQNRVFHRDVKSSNVMLDSSYNARLGDFGLARSVQHDGKTHHTTGIIAGTPGYVAPEYFLTGRANGETDVYGFGVFIMEVACGKRPYNSTENNGNGINSENVKWLWDLYGRGKILDAADPKLDGIFDKQQMETVLRLGLACCHPNPNERPSMRLAIQVLKGQAVPPELPMEKPAFMWPVVNISLEELVTIDLDE